jgi:hypothetical protein
MLLALLVLVPLTALALVLVMARLEESLLSVPSPPGDGAVAAVAPATGVASVRAEAVRDVDAAPVATMVTA